jgi:hypothetical protein
LGPAIERIPSLMMQYEQLKRQREAEKRSVEDTEFERAMKRVQAQVEMLKLGRETVQTLPGGGAQTYPGITGYEVVFDDRGIPSLKKTGEVPPTPGVGRVIGSPGQPALNIPKSEFLKTPEKYAGVTGLKVIDDTAMGQGAEGKKQLSPAEVRTMTEGASVSRMLPDIEKIINENPGSFGPFVGRVGEANPYAEKAQTLQAQIRAVSQAFGRFMEGGVLRKEDEEKYYKMFPQLRDKPNVAKNKLANVRDILSRQYEDKKNSLNESGYDVTGLIDLSGVSTQGEAQGQVGGGTMPDATAKTVTTQEAYNALPPGATYVGPDGVTRRKK